MKNVVAFVVGIDCYAQPGWNVPGPCANAVAIAQWLLGAGAAPQRIFLFVDAYDQSLDSAIAELAQRGVAVRRAAEHCILDKFWRDALLKDQPQDGRLFVYWSGHGFADRDGQRIFLCNDYTHPQLANCVFNSSNVLRHLRSPAYQNFREQILLADVCALQASVAINADKLPPSQQQYATRQLAFYATPEGQYAKGENGRGVFTQIALDVLQKFNAWPALEHFRDRMLERFATADQQLFRVAHLENQADISDSMFGRLPIVSSDSPGDSLVQLLSATPLADSLYRPHFLRTVSSLRMPALAGAQGLSGMIRELAAQRDAATPQQISHGLLQFLLRLRQEGTLTAIIDGWLRRHAAHEGNRLATLQQMLQDEAATKILIVEVDNDERGEISGYELSVRTSNLRLIPTTKCQQVVHDWDDFAARLLTDIDTLRAEHAIEDFQLQFLVNPPLFDRPFHRIATKAGDILGEERVVLVRHRDRLRMQSGAIHASWKRYAEALRQVKPSELKLVPVAKQAGATGLLPTHEGLCYTNFLVQPCGSDGHKSPEKEVLKRLLRSGVPYIYWLHELPEPSATFTQIEAQFGNWLPRANSLDEFPALFREQRSLGNGFAGYATLLWDDPQFNPFRS